MSEIYPESWDGGPWREPFPGAFREAIRNALCGNGGMTAETGKNMRLVLESLGHTPDKPSGNIGREREI